MKSRVSRVLAVGIALAAAAAVYAQTETLTADVPFQFYVGSRLMPQGSYRVEQNADGHVAWVRATGQKAVQPVTAFAVIGNKTTEPARLVFHRYGDEYFLTQIWSGSSSLGMQLGVSAREKELAQDGVPGAVAIIRVVLVR